MEDRVKKRLVTSGPTGGDGRGGRGGRLGYVAYADKQTHTAQMAPVMRALQASVLLCRQVARHPSQYGALHH